MWCDIYYMYSIKMLARKSIFLTIPNKTNNFNFLLNKNKSIIVKPLLIINLFYKVTEKSKLKSMKTIKKSHILLCSFYQI